MDCTNNNLKSVSIEREAGGAKLTASVSPCSWMYPNHFFQITIKMEGGGVCYLHDKEKRYETATIEDMNTLLDKVGVVLCTRCGKPAFDPTTVNTNRGGLCEKCFCSDLDEEFKKIAEKEEKKLKRLDANRKNDGFTHRIDAWIHPTRGDDQQLSIWMKNPTKAQIEAELRKAGSRVLGDYKIIAL